MVKKLRRKFVVTAMLSLLVIIIVMIGIMNVANIHSMYQDADNLLSMLADNDGFFPDMIFMTPQNSKNPPKDLPSSPNDSFSFDRIKNTRSAEMPYQSRYFFVRFDSDGNIVSTDLSHIAAISESSATEYATYAYNSGKNRGRYHTYRFRIVTKEDGSCLVLFVDLSASIISAYTLLGQSLLIGAFALIAMFILVYIFSSQAVAPVVESLEKQKRFITDAGHELKTPLAVISANVDVLELESGKSEWTSSIKNQTKRMNDLVKNLLTLSRMDEEVINVVYSDIDISSIIKDTASSFEAMASSKGKNYQTNIEDGIFITGDKSAITQLASLLIDNAMKYSSDKGVINVSLSKNKNIVFEVSNTCDHVPDGNLDRLFDRFYRADSSRARETGGYGIGLSVAKAIANSHGGTIEAKRDGDKVIRFIVTLPKQLPKNLQKTSKK